MNYMKNGENGHETMPGQDAPESDGIQWKKVIIPPANEEELGEIREEAGLNERIQRKGKPIYDSRGSSSIGRRR